MIYTLINTLKNINNLANFHFKGGQKEKEVVGFAKSRMCVRDFHVFPEIVEGRNTAHSKTWHHQVNHSFH